MGPGGIFRRSAAALALALVAGCAVAPAPAPVTPEPRPPEVSRAIVPQPSAQSRALSLYYARLQNDLLARGLLRRDGGGPDTPFTDTMLARNFVQIALYDEYVASGGVIRAETTESRLRRWDGPVSMSIEFGASVPEAQRAGDAADIVRFANRLSRITGTPIRQSGRGANFHVLVLSEDDRRGFEPRLRELVPGIAESSVRAFMSIDRSTLCLVMAFSSGQGAGYSRAVALIRAEHPDLLRLSCIHEELAQGMGLANDSPAARPSIFNDDEEFGLLTTHDELLLRMLYDPRMRTGMTVDEAAPVSRTIAAELLGGEA